MAPVSGNTVDPISAGASSADVSATSDGSSVTPEPTPEPAPIATDEATPSATSINSSASSAALYPELASKINDSKNVLIALSSDPSVDEMAAAIGLSLFLDRIGKRATAIYSGTTPNALEFLKPEETFESTADTLQDFVIALNKEKADHLRYKLDGDFVKIYITPYKTRISEDDLEFSYGDFNVDLVLALDVANGIDLDSALREHGRIMHDAAIINITTGKPGKFGEIEWSDKTASSVSEMIAKLLYSVDSGVKIEKEEATAFLTGIVAATNRFSSASTTPETMQIASKLMRSGANQQLVSKNITPDIENEMSLRASEIVPEPEDTSKTDTSEANAQEESDSDTTIEEKETLTKEDPTTLDIKRDKDGVVEEKQDENKEVETPVAEKDNSLLEDLKAAEASLSQAGAETTPEADKTKLTINSEETTGTTTISEPEAQPENVESASKDQSESVDSTDHDAEKILQPLEGDTPIDNVEDENKYGHMLEEALSSINSTPTPASDSTAAATTSASANPAATNAPAVSSTPEINGVPGINYMPMPGDEVLPPPPAPPIDMSTVGTPQAPQMPTPSLEPIAPAAPAVEPTLNSLGDQPAMQDQVYGPQSSDPGAFKIPGM